MGGSKTTELDVIGKTVLVTGAAKRVGSTVAGELHRAGANVAIHYRTAQAAATALAAPPDEPPGVSAALRGLSVRPCSWLLVNQR